MFRFTIFRIPVEVQPFFWLTMILLGYLFTGGSSQGTPLEILLIALFVIAGFVSILIHELGHALVAKKFGAPTAIVLQAFGGYATYPAGMMSRAQSFLITAAGPGVQLLLSAVAYFAFLKFHGQFNENIQFFVQSLYFVSFYWALLNLLPILPLDGGQMVNAILGPKRVRLTLWITVVLGVAFAILALVFTKSIFFPIFLGMFAWQAFQQLRLTR